MKRRITKLAVMAVTLVCTLMAVSTSASACLWGCYQPEEPECLRK